MMVYIEDIAGHAGQTVTLKGWLHNRRSSGKIHFLTLRDGTGFIQCVMSKAAVGDEAFGRADHLSQESAITITGAVRADALAHLGPDLTDAAIDRRTTDRRTDERRALDARPVDLQADDVVIDLRDGQPRVEVLREPEQHARRRLDTPHHRHHGQVAPRETA
mgnify:CR=1 FL=1